jgi:hypothetical protein
MDTTVGIEAMEKLLVLDLVLLVQEGRRVAITGGLNALGA